MERKKKKENIINVPTFLNLARIVLTFVVVYMIITNRSIKYIVAVFAIAAITDWFDGRIARKYNLVNDFGRKADMVADRFLWICTAFAFFVVFGIRDQLNILHGIQLLLIMSREIISAPSAIVAFFSGKGFPNARYVAKVTTFAQGFALPALMLSIYYPAWQNLALPLSIILGIVGTASGFHYIADVQRIEEKKTKK
ncbi:MAG: CDP-alcohol phosphatidyltransferase family protein [Nanoarchaeota archaeon]